MKRTFCPTLIFMTMVMCIPVTARTGQALTHSDVLDTAMAPNAAPVYFGGGKPVHRDDPPWRYNVGLLALAETREIAPETHGPSSRWNWHRFLGWSTIAAAVATVITGAASPGDAHCALAGVSTGLAAATCINGYYTYGDVLGFREGDPRYTAHAIMGTLATAGFAASLAMADGEGHALVGGISGAVFALTVGIAYF
jgi:hypothetical protein